MAVSLAVDPGHPLSIDERRKACLRLLTLHFDWSDRRIGVLCGLSGKTVGRLRREAWPAPQEPASVDRAAPKRRVGLDGKARPVDGSDVRERITAALTNNPRASLRAIARMAEASPETVRSVRARLADRATSENAASLGSDPNVAVLPA